MRRVDRCDRQAVRLGHAVNIISRHDTACRGHVLHDNVGITRKIFADVVRQQPRVHIIGGARAGADDKAYGLTLIIRRLRHCVRGGQQQRQYDDNKQHETSFTRFV